MIFRNLTRAEKWRVVGGRRHRALNRRVHAEQRRHKVLRMFYSGVTQVEIARVLGVHPSTISRDLRRINPDHQGHLYRSAEERAALRHLAALKMKED